VTVVNRSDIELATEVRLRDAAWDGRLRVRVLTAGERAAGELGLDQIHLEEGTEEGKGESVRLSLPPRSFTVLEAGLELGG
jgi:hypothetical protein